MSDKRFKKGDNLSCVDTGTGKSYYYSCNLVGLLNEQQATINKLKEENEQLEQKIKDKNKYQRVLEAKIRRLKDRIKVLEK